MYVNTQSALFFLRICKNRVPNVLHVHEIVENPALVAKFINRKSLKWADKIIAVSEPVKGNLLKYAPVRFSYKVEVVLNGIEDVFGGEGRGLNNEGRSKIVITLIGRIKPEKGIWFFLDAIAALSDEVARRCIFNIVGSAAPNGESWVEKLRSDIEHHKFKENIKYTSFITDVSDIQKEADILVVPSLMRDPFPTTVLEAMAAGKPVIATNNGGAVQAISHGETGYLIAPGDIKQFAAYMEQLIENKDLRNSLGLNGRKTYASRFTMKEFEASFLKTFLTR
ncbi:hypothetical protein GCM10011379_50710 [Filimonas zeae]|uniref:Glycosyl transferase family 1 domain-containing protein n=1 Tax=Filimonas zeae TaxID=1737353 RepID=A0A917J4T5_9BACT|nr:hypothetical protein GCM10011379_50710 [Filimonas zeae]